jgi:malonyl-CoA/methylmalonyl-CoA synthetase
MALHFLNDLRSSFEARAGQVALIYRERSYTYGELDARARAFGTRLQALGIAPGERVALITQAKFPFLVAHLSTLYAGAISLPLNPKFTAEELKFFLRDSGARLAIVGDDRLGLVESLRPLLPALSDVIPDNAVSDAGDGTYREPGVAGGDPALMIYSSGTTGWPKGIVHTHANIASSLQALQSWWRMTAEDRVVNVLPLYHVHGLSFATLMTWLSGGTVLVEENFHPLQSLDAVGRGTVFMAVPTIYYRFLEQPEFRSAASGWTNVRLFTCGSAPIRPEVLPTLEEILRRPVINRYGMTEAHVITSLPLDGPWPAGSVGTSLQGMEVNVVSETGATSAPGEVGSVRVRGPNLFREYWGQPDATREAFAGGWFDTGDLGQMDTRRFLTLVGRKNDLIITSGYNVYPQVVERVINGCPGVAESAVVGIPDPRRGERVAVALVRNDPAVNEARLHAWWSERLVDYQRPLTVLFVDALPRNTMGKVLRRELRQRMEQMA